MILGDYHTHTKNSDGKGLLIDTLTQADKIGLLEVGISDHGLRHSIGGMKFKDIAKMRKQIDDTRSQFKVNCLLSIESNIYSANGDIDLKPQEYDLFDYVIGGYHKAALPKTFKDFFTYSMPALFASMGNYTDRQRRKYTKTVVAAIKSNKLNILVHLNYGIPCFIKDIAKAALDYNTYIELNGKKVSLTDDEVCELNALGVKFVLNSDAHTPDRIGEVSVPLAVVERVGIAKDRIFNWERLPQDIRLKR